MLAKTYSAAIIGIDACPVEVEINATGKGEASYVSIVGLPDNAVKESRDRVRSALQSCGYTHPKGATLVNLAPADIKKEGAAFDLPIALGMLAATGIIDRESFADTMIMGELALDGSVRSVRGALPSALSLRKIPEAKAFILPASNAAEAAAAAGNIPVYGVNNLLEAVSFFSENDSSSPVAVCAEFDTDHDHALEHIDDFSEVKGQAVAKRALEISAAGGHNVLMCGPPGTGKSMLAKRLPGIIPPMSLEETLETSRIHSILGLLGADTPLLRLRPFRSPHHTVSDAGLLGGGQTPSPGEISLAHNGVLFLDELPEFKRNVLEVLRQPLENGTVTVSRASGSFEFPARFILVAAMNPCPCGHYGDMHRECRCTPPQIQRYRSKISGPLLDRIDIHVEVAALDENELLSAPAGECSAEIRKRVIAAREIQRGRFSGSGIFCNAHMRPRQLHEFCTLDRRCETHLRHAIREMGLSARAYDRILRVARTIADLANRPNISEEHIFEAVNYRSLDRRMW